jgi:hypothetical protein
MSQPRRRRRSRRRRGSGGGSGSQNQKQAAGQNQSKVVREQAPGASGRRSSRGRRRGRGGAQVKSPASSEDLVRAEPKPVPGQLTAPHDGTTLDEVIADLQSDWGVPQHPQEYRITLKVAEERDGRAEGATIVEERQDPKSDQTPPEEAGLGRPKREKAPAAPRITGDGEEATAAKSTSRKRSRRRRRRGRRGPSGGSNTGPPTT